MRSRSESNDVRRQAVAKGMKRLPILSLLLILACSPDQDTTSEAAPTVDPIQTAAARADSALMRDYDLELEQRRKFKQAPLPALPGIADDSTFLRRACIDLAGRLPKPEEVRAFLADNTIGKRARLTDALVKEPGAAEVRFRMLAEAFRVKNDAEVITWLRRAAKEDMPFDQIAAVMVGDRYIMRRDEGNALRSGVEVAQALFGQDLYCAMCHDHPYNDHMERECYEFAACFASGGELRLPKDYLYKDGNPGDVVRPKYLNRSGGRNEANLPRDMKSMEGLVKWLTSTEDRHLATVAALRAWSGLFGMPGLVIDSSIGGVEEAPAWHEIHPKPVLNLTSSNCFAPPNRGRVTWVDMEASKYPEAVKVLAAEFRRCGMRIAEFQRILVSTNAYSRSGVDYNFVWSGLYLAPAPQIRRLPSEVIWDTLSSVKSDELPQVQPANHPLRLLGQGTREWADESATPLSHELARFMMNGDMVAQASEQAVDVDTLFLNLLARHPTENERTAISREAATHQDVAWALLNTKEFIFRP